MIFSEKLTAAIERNRSLLCVGLDPNLDLMPLEYRNGIFEFNRAIIDATSDLVCAYKPNVAFYEALNNGHNILVDTIKHIRKTCNVPIIGDSKRGDVPDTSVVHAKVMFDKYEFDAATINPYAGHDAVQPFLDYEDRGVFVWCRSSNRDAGELQDLVASRPGREERHPLYEWIAISGAQWNEQHHNVGLVVGAPYPEELGKVRALCPDMPILIPGVGAQEGSVNLAIKNGVDQSGRNAIIHTTRTVIYASRDGSDFDKKARKVALELRQFIQGQLAFLDHAFPPVTASSKVPA